MRFWPIRARAGSNLYYKDKEEINENLPSSADVIHQRKRPRNIQTLSTRHFWATDANLKWIVNKINTSNFQLYDVNLKRGVSWKKNKTIIFEGPKRNHENNCNVRRPNEKKICDRAKRRSNKFYKETLGTCRCLPTLPSYIIALKAIMTSTRRPFLESPENFSGPKSHS